MSSDIRNTLKGGITVGHGTFVMGMEIINPFGVVVDVGKYCSISLNLNVFGYDHACINLPKVVTTWPFDSYWGVPPFIGQDGSMGYQKKTSVTIGNDVWTGMDIHIRPGVTIGDGAIIGACSVITKDVPPYAIVGGNPFKIIRYRYTQEQIEKLLQIKWWDWSEAKIKEHYYLFNDVDEFINTHYEKIL